MPNVLCTVCSSQFTETPAAKVRRMAERCAALEFEAIHDAFEGRDIAVGGKAAVARSAERYCCWAAGMVEA